MVLVKRPPSENLRSNLKAGYKVVLGAGDTFRAAAIDQLQIWADRVGVLLLANKYRF
jgi:signal recognition particle GTPase